MSVDLNGFISIPPPGRIQPVFTTTVADVVSRLKSQFPTLIHSLYVYGSVAQGKALPGRSDLDLTVIFTTQPDAAALQQLEALQVILESTHPEVSKIDFDCGVLVEVLKFENRLSWGYWLKHHCVCVYGDDLSLHFGLFRPSPAIALAVNGDFMAVIHRLASQIRETDDPARQRQWLRAAARKAIRATSILRGPEDTDWPDTLQQHAEKFMTRYPQHSVATLTLLDLCTVFDGDICQDCETILAFARRLQQESAGRIPRSSDTENHAL
ncbi:nucleotidyltransferase domain-containing protein [Tatumella sp. UBA2305]|uniref:nucleotidyltransferase domain-containing protein n=1 Tax=Tatumella sp. UBA2305 TaxID=1947647 RepID=UPI0025F87173|nr:nucleotidyltransferase domain-containing protein [Tatumella sp. UBA2305]